MQEEKSDPGAGRSDLNDNLNEGELEAKMSAFAGLDINSLRELISKASSNLSGDPAFYLKLVSDLTSKTQRRAEGEANPSPAEDQGPIV